MTTTKTYHVQHEHCDGKGPRRSYKTLESAVKRIELYLGAGRIPYAIEECFYNRSPLPTIEQISRLRAVDDGGGVVNFWVTTREQA